MPTIRVTQANGRAFTAAAGAHHYRMIGLNVTKAAGVPDDSALIDMSNGADHILVDRSLVHGCRSSAPGQERPIPATFRTK
jgi:hypothetical protein